MTTIDPVLVLISDIHFTTATLELASSALRQALTKARQLQVPCVIAGDTLDSKAIIRGECANRLIEIFREFEDVYTIMLVGNHDLLNEKASAHSLNFLSPYLFVVSSPVEWQGFHLIPYQSDSQALQELLTKIPKGSTLIMHQGVQGAEMGHYIKDSTSLPREAFAGFRVISGHYHKAQDIFCAPVNDSSPGGWVGVFSYIGNPYTNTFGEANDGAKGFRILHKSGALTSVPTNLRKHVIHQTDEEGLWLWMDTGSRPTAGDLFWLKVTGAKSELAKLNKKEIGKRLFGHSNFKLDLIPTGADEIEHKADALQDTEVLDSIIESLAEPKEFKAYLKKLWREIL